MMEYKGLSVDSAAAQAIAKVGKLGGTGGVIALDRHGNMAMPFNSPGMYRAYIDAGGKVVVKIFRE
jgi:beta-aspartyl-peptidase (threonine type)